MAYGQGSGANGGGSCPSTHPVKLPQIMYEVMWDVNKFADKSLWPTDGSDPFVYSMNIGGAAAHGDYVFGWEGDSLQKAMDNNCNLNTACPKAGLTVQQPATYNACKKKQQAPEEVNGCKSFEMVIWIENHLLTCEQGLRRCRLVPWRRRLRRLVVRVVETCRSFRGDAYFSLVCLAFVRCRSVVVQVSNLKIIMRIENSMSLFSDYRDFRLPVSND